MQTKSTIILIILFSILIFANKVLAQCTVNIGNDRTICLGTEIILTATGGETYLWNTGENTESIIVSPTETSTYSVTATCDDLSTSVAEITVFVNPLPEINIGNDTSICLNDSLHLVATGGQSYLWSNNKTENNIYVKPQITTDYWVTIIDNNNCQNSDTITVGVYALPVLSICDDQEICPHDTALLTVTTGASIYLWNTGETTSYISVSPIETSNYVVTVTDENNCSNNDTTIVAVTTNPIADFTFTEPCMPFASFFTDISTDSENNIIYRSWHFDDTEGANVQNPEHFYSFAGVYDVRLIVESDKSCKDSITKSVQIFPKPVAAFSMSDTSSCNSPITIQFTDQSEDVSTWSWDFSNGQTSILQYPDATFEDVGTYQIQLIVESLHACKDTATHNFTVYQKPILEFTSTPTQGCEPLDVELTNQSQFYDTCYWYIDNQFYYSNEATHTFIGDNLYTITLQAENENCTETLTKTDYIEAFLKPTSNFEFYPDSICGYPVEIQFNDLSENTDMWEYTFDTGNISLLQNPSQIFDTSAVYNITQIVKTTNNCSDTTTQTFTVFQPPIIDFETDIDSGCEPITVSFTNNTLYGENYAWDIDNQIFIDSNVVYEFYGEGFYDVKLKSVSKDGCEEEVLKSNLIEVLNTPETDFSWEEETEPFPYGQIYFENLTENANYYYWDFGDTLNTFEFEPTHRYETFGDFEVTQIAYDTISYCSDTLVYEIYVEYFDGLFIPTAFMPDAGYGESKIFLPKGTHLVEYEISIYNNSGNLMWTSSLIDSGGNPTESWDGKYKEKNMPQGIYFWKANATFENDIEWKGQKQKNGKYSKSGILTLIR